MFATVAKAAVAQRSRRVPLSIVGPSETPRSVVINPARTVNAFLEVTGEGRAAKGVLIGSPGLEETWDLGAVCRGHHVFKGRFFVVAGNTVYELLEGGTTTTWGTIPSSTGRVGMSDNAGKIVIGDGVGLFVLNLDDMTIIETLVEGVTPIPSSQVGYIDGFTIAVLVDSGQVLYSNILDPTTFSGLDFFTAEAAVDDAVSLIINNEEVFILGSGSIEPWRDTGDADNAFERIEGGGVSFKGCGAPFSATLFDNSFVWVGDKPVIYRMNGYTPQIISNNAVAHALSRMDDMSTVTAFSWQEENHDFVQFNMDDTSWIYDASVKAWHERVFLNKATGKQERHRAEFCAYVFGANYVGDYQNGKVYRQDLTVYSDNGDSKVFSRRLAIPHADVRGTTVDRVEIFGEWGIGLDGLGADGLGLGVDPKMMLRFSPDGGRTWQNTTYRPMGRIGETDMLVAFDRVGSGPNPVVEISCSEPVRLVVTGGYADVA